MSNNIFRILLDTNIIAYIIAADSGNLDYRLRAKIAKYLIQRGDTIIILYEEQRKREIPAAFDDLIITGKARINITSVILEEFEEYLDSLESIGKIRIVKRGAKLLERARELYRILDKHYNGSIRGKISSDLKILAAAEMEEASITTRDNQFYQYYKETLHGKTATPSMYYLDVETNNRRAGYRICGQRIQPLDESLLKTCSEEDVICKDPSIDCGV